MEILNIDEKKSLVEDIMAVRRDALCARSKNRIPSIICPFFDQQGYLYTIDNNSGNFTIIVDDYSTIEGILECQRYEVFIKTKIDAIEEKSWSPIYLALTDFSYHKSLFDALIEGVKKLPEKFYNRQKIMKSAELLTISCVQPYIDKLNLKTAKLIVLEDEPGTLIVRAPVCNNYHLQSRISIDNYEQRCEDLASAVQCVSPLFPANVKRMLVFHFDNTFYNRPNITNDFIECAGTDSWNIEGRRMTYQNQAEINKLITGGLTNCNTTGNLRLVSESKVVNQALDELGFQYYVSRGILIVFINMDCVLTREESSHKVVFQHYPKLKLNYSDYWESRTMHDKEFITLLKLIAISPNAFKSYDPGCDHSQPEGIYRLFRSIAPKNWFISKYGLRIIINKKYCLSINNTSGQSVNAIWTILNNQEMLNNLPNLFSDNPHIETYCEENKY